jgi:hypothetical protein
MKREEIVSLPSALRFLARGDDRGQRQRLAVILFVMAVCLSGVLLVAVLVVK